MSAYFLQRAGFDVCAVAGGIVKQIHQLTALFQIKPHLAGLAQQRQFIQMFFACSDDSRCRCAAAASPGPFSSIKTDSLTG